MIDRELCFGPVRSGMTLQQVVAEIGEPDQKKDGLLEYQNLGFAVLGAKKGLVGGVVCMDSREGSPFKRFAGRTREGIGIGSSRAEVISAYGDPPKVVPNPGKPGFETLRYKGIDFKVGDGKVYLIAVFF